MVLDGSGCDATTVEGVIIYVPSANPSPRRKKTQQSRLNDQSDSMLLFLIGLNSCFLTFLFASKTPNVCHSNVQSLICRLNTRVPQ